MIGIVLNLLVIKMQVHNHINYGTFKKMISEQFPCETFHFGGRGNTHTARTNYPQDSENIAITYNPVYGWSYSGKNGILGHSYSLAGAIEDSIMAYRLLHA